MSTKILFVFEGDRTEGKIVNSLEKHFLKENMSGDAIIKCSFGAEIYQLFYKIQNDPDLDTFNLIKERNSASEQQLKEYKREDFAEIYLFFDYDGHSSLACNHENSGNQKNSGDEILSQMLSLFDNETEKGKLYISYPMVEAIRHIIDFDVFHELKVKGKGGNCINFVDCEDKEECMSEPHYKEIVSKECKPQLCHMHKYNKELWQQIIKSHIFKMNYIVNDSYAYPSSLVSQYEVFSGQLEKSIDSRCQYVFVLSAFPMFIHDYFGNLKTKELIGAN